jgi:sulfur-oxidizing protein SoxY
MIAATRRAVLLLPVVATAAAAQEADMAAAERAILDGRAPIDTGIAFEMPPLSENGNAVDVAVRVDSPMTAQDHVRAIHILSEKNPVPRVVTFTLTPRAGRAEVATRIRLATSQRIVVLAETSAGVVHRAVREVIVVLGACVETG